MRAAELHDVGKIAIPDEILAQARAARPTTSGRSSASTRSSASGSSAPRRRCCRSPSSCAPRHERWDGSGYPDGLAGEQIPLGARIVAVCDAFDAMTTTGPTARRFPVADALAELRRCAGTQFDPAVVNAFADVQADLIAELVA